MTPAGSRLRRKAACTPSSAAAWLMVRAGKSGSSRRPTGSPAREPGAVMAVPRSRVVGASWMARGPGPRGPGPRGLRRRSALDRLPLGRLALDGATLDGLRGVRPGDRDLAGPCLLGHRDADGEHAVVVVRLEPVGVQAPAEDELPRVAAEGPLGDRPLGVVQLRHRALRGDGERG